MQLAAQDKTAPPAPENFGGYKRARTHGTFEREDGADAGRSIQPAAPPWKGVGEIAEHLRTGHSMAIGTAVARRNNSCRLRTGASPSYWA